MTASARGRDIRESGPKDDVTVPLLHFRFTPIADIDHHRIDVRFAPEVATRTSQRDSRPCRKRRAESRWLIA